MSDYFENLERRLGESVRRGAHEPRRLPARPPHAVPIAVALAVAIVAGALLVSGGSGTRRGHSTLAPATAGSGSWQLLALRVADPAGGAPWGLRTIRTSAGATCAEPGRVEHGRIAPLGGTGSGVLRILPPPAAPEGAAGDGLVHIRPPSTRNPRDCTEGAGHILEVAHVKTSVGGGTTGRRWISYGLLGPHAINVTYLDRGRRVSRAVEPGTGAYLLVLASAAGEQVRPRVLTITYRHGSTLCRVTAEAKTRGSAAQEQIAPCSGQ